VEPMYSCL